MSSSENFHAGSRATQEYLYDPDIPAPTHAERARTLAAGITSGTLCTLLNDESEPAGHPYGSLVTTALSDGSPIFLISALAEHTRNLAADNRCSLLLTEAGEDNPLALGRITLLGQAERLENDASNARDDYLRSHPQAGYYLEFGDFSFWRLNVESLRYIGGFGRMSWVSVDDWYGAEPDPIAAAASGVLAHMNDDHADALREYCLAFSRARDFSDVAMVGIDRYGFEMSLETAEGARPVRVAFDSALNSPDEVRPALVELVSRARALLARQTNRPHG